MTCAKNEEEYSVKLIMTLIHQNNLYNCVFEHNKNITVSEAYGADVCVPDISDPIRIGWDTVRSEIAVSCGNNKKWVGFNHPLSMNNANAVFYFSKLMPVSCKFSVQTSCLIQVGTGSVSSEKQIDMSIAVPTLLENYLRIENRAGAVYVYDENCANRLYVNGKRISTAKLYDGDIISVAFLQIVFVRGYFYVRNVSGEAISVANGKLAYYKVASTNRNEDLFIPKSPRLVEKVAQEVIALEKPPQAGGPPQINWLNILIMPICSITLMAVLVILMGMSPIMLIMSGTMTVISLILAVVNYFKQTKQHKSYSGLIDEKYQAYLAEMQEKIQQSKNRQLTVLLHDNPSPDECVQLATDRSTRLWERTLDDEDFMRVRIGLGTIHSAVIGTYQRPQIVLEENELENKAIEIAENSRMVENAPILCDLSAQKLIGFVGERSASTEMLRCMVTELCAQHSYDELKVVAIVPENEVTQWAWLRWLPHCADNQRQKNYLFTSLGDAESVLTEIDAELTHRNMEDQRTRTTSDLIPHYLVISAKQGVLEHHAVWSNLVSDDHLGCTTLLAYNKLTALPSLCGTIIEANGGFGTMYSRTESFPKQAFQCDRCSVEQADRFARALAPLVTETSGSANLPMVVSFLDGYGVSTPEELKIAQRWEKAKTYKSMAVPIAALSGGTPFAFDINEKKHGVHGLVAGMSGSGKTEMVQTWLLSLAVHFSPEDLNFVLIDFKGTGMIAPFQEIPHLAGSISNLDSREDINRNLKSLKNEIERRERILNEYLAKGKNIDPSDININKLNKAYDNGLVPEKLPVLIVAIDEFAEFKMQYPDFGKAIESLLATGRSLGIFIVLMTQNPAGVVSGLMESNIRYRWCLRVANHAASREMLGCADASKITNPGRAFVKVGEQLFEEVQSYYSKAPYMPEKHKHDQTQAMIRILAPNRNVIFSESTNRRENEQSGKTEIGVIVQHIIDLCDAKGIPSAKKVWLDKLPE